LPNAAVHTSADTMISTRSAIRTRRMRDPTLGLRLAARHQGYADDDHDHNDEPDEPDAGQRDIHAGSIAEAQ
jgi:hypothetical protein